MALPDAAVPMQKLHPLDPLQVYEIEQTSTLIKAQFPKGSVHFTSISLIEAPKKKLKEYVRAERSSQVEFTAIARKTSAVWFLRDIEQFYVATVNIDAGEIEHLAQIKANGFPNIDAEDMNVMRELCIHHPEVKAALKKFQLPEGAVIICNTWTYGRDDFDEKRRLIQVCLNG
jgi:primary-amine oxidase